MKNMLRAVVVAMLFATGAQAATVDGLFESVPGGALVIPGSYTANNIYYFKVTLDPSQLDLLPAGKTQADIVGSELYFYISGQGVTAGPGLGGQPTVGQVTGPGLTYWLPWMWRAAGGTDFQFQGGFLKRFYNAQETGTVIRNEVTGLFEGDSHNEDIGVPTRVGQLAVQNPTPVPIGGTLPLMLSALGIGAFMMRRRAKAALA